MHPSSLLSYYPTYSILDEVVAKNNYKTLNLYFDLKNNLQSTYMQHAIVNIVESSKRSKYVDTSVFSSLISFLTFHKIWGIKRGIDVNFYIFFETGKSFYHKNISKKYKISRQIDDLYGLDRVDRDLFFHTLQSNFQLIEKACNLLPKVKVIRLQNLEADFIPYYLITRNKVSRDENVGHLIYSNDHDLLQCIRDHVFIFSKSGKYKKLVQKNEVMKNLLKKENDISDEYITLAMSITGDVGDDVDGVPNVGPARFIGAFNELVSITGNMDNLFNKVENDLPIFDPLPTKIGNKYLKKIIESETKNQQVSKSLKLVSFELLSRALDNPKSTEILEKRKSIEKILNEDKVVPKESLINALERNGVILEESIDFLYI
jgi:5'-3' exonuclease, N-terminal resolvase-like domain